VANLAWATAKQGRVSEGLQAAREAVALSKHTDVREAGGARTVSAAILLDAGDAQGAELEARRALELLAGAPPGRPRVQALLARAVAASGRPAEALAIAEQGMRGVDGVEQGEALVRLTYVELLHAAGRVEEAKEAARVAKDRLLERASKIVDPDWRRSFLVRVAEHARTVEIARDLGVQVFDDTSLG